MIENGFCSYGECPPNLESLPGAVFVINPGRRFLEETGGLAVYLSGQCRTLIERAIKDRLDVMARSTDGGYEVIAATGLGAWVDSLKSEFETSQNGLVMLLDYNKNSRVNI